MTEERLIALLCDHVPHGESPRGPGDDAAVLSSLVPGATRCITADAYVEGVHFWRHHPPAWLARKLLVANLADVGAMGAQAEAFTLTASLPVDVPEAWWERFARGLGAGCREAGVELVGGDVTGSPGPVMLTISAWGQVPDGGALTRTGGQADDLLMVTGVPGLPRLGWDAWRATPGAGWGGDPPDGPVCPALRAHLCPSPDLDAGPWALQAGAHAGLDLSDGLARDGQRLALASSLDIELQLDLLPAPPQGLTLDDQTRLSGGEEHELLVLVAAAERGVFEARGFTTIGHASVSENEPRLRCVRGGVEVDLHPTPFEHFPPGGTAS